MRGLGHRPPDRKFLDWMVGKQIINSYSFKNRKSRYYGRGISGNYEYMNDADTEDDPFLGNNAPIPPKTSPSEGEMMPPGEMMLLKLDDLKAYVCELEERIEDLEKKVAKLSSEPEQPDGEAKVKKTKARSKVTK
jgi:hypothetical protein